MIKVTIAIPVYNAELYLKEAIQSVLNQTFKSFQLIILNDGSTDSSMKIANGFLDPRIQIIDDGKNEGLQYRLNQIIDIAETTYLARMDADDIMHPQKLEKQIDVLNNNTDIDVLGTNAYTINHNSEVVGIRFKPSIKKLSKTNGFIHPTIIGKTEWFRKNRYDNKADRIEDTELWYRTSKISNFMLLTEPLFFYREVGFNYYKKYFLANSSKLYILDKHKNDKYWKRFFFLNNLKGILYRLFNIFKGESLLICRRNDIIFKKRKNYLNYIIGNDINN